MKKIRLNKTAGLSLRELELQLANGGTFVIYGYVVSIIALTFRLTSDPYLISPGERRSSYRRKYNVITCIFGWWGIPKGFVYSILMLKLNREKTVVDVTPEMKEKLIRQFAGRNASEKFEEDIMLDFTAPELTRNVAQHNSFIS
ncbi:MAG TPA: hypothetical protein VL651_02170 [Bacteroidia bacterium]|jgi:hypothetical protein|nr:hypothetical protein [Bacteroidia bacterium]